MSTELALVPIEKIPALEIFKRGGVDAILERIESEARSEAAKLDISTKGGREAIASLAHKVARSKTFLDDQGKSLVEEEKKRLALIDADRKIARERLDALKAEVRKPLTDWESAERGRVAAHEAALGEMEALGRQPMATTADVTAALETLKGFKSRSWEEFETRAKATMGLLFRSLQAAFEDIKQREAERAELARLQAEKIEREQKERDERIAREAQERERQLSQEREQAAARAAEAERLRIERERNEADARAKQAEAARLQAIADAEARAERERLAGIERERIAAERAAAAQREAVAAEGRRIEAQRQKEQQEAQERERNKAHVAKINREVLADLVRLNCPVSEETLKIIIAAISKGSIAHTKITY